MVCPSEYAGGPPVPVRVNTVRHWETLRQQVPSSGAAPPLFLVARLMRENKAQHEPPGTAGTVGTVGTAGTAGLMKEESLHPRRR